MLDVSESGVKVAMGDLRSASNPDKAYERRDLLHLLPHQSPRPHRIQVWCMNTILAFLVPHAELHRLGQVSLRCTEISQAVERDPSADPERDGRRLPKEDVREAVDQLRQAGMRTGAVKLYRFL